MNAVSPDPSGITEDTIEKAARAYAKIEGHDYDAVSAGNRMAFYGAAGAILEAALAGRAVVDLPEPDAVDHAGNPIWNLTVAGNDVTVCVDEGKPMVSALSPCDPADLAEAYGLALIAGARAARRMAAEQSSRVAGGGAR